MAAQIYTYEITIVLRSYPLKKSQDQETLSSRTKLSWANSEPLVEITAVSAAPESISSDWAVVLCESSPSPLLSLRLASWGLVVRDVVWLDSGVVDGRRTVGTGLEVYLPTFRRQHTRSTRKPSMPCSIPETEDKLRRVFIYIYIECFWWCSCSCYDKPMSRYTFEDT